MAILTVGFNPAIDRVLECPGFHIGGHQQARQIARLASGKAANVSRALALLGVDSMATGFVGTEELEFFHEQLLLAGPGRILCHFVEIGGKTRENITILDSERHVETHLRDRGFAVNYQEIELLDRKIMHDLKPGDIVIFSGSLCLGLPSDYFGHLIERCTLQQARVVVDSNGEPLIAAAKKPLWALKPNVEELQQLLGKPVPEDPAALRNAAVHLTVQIEHLLVSRGARGAILLTPGRCFMAVPPPGPPAVRTIGCGDHLLAGFISELAAGREPGRALAFAVAVATARAVSPKLDEFAMGDVQAILDGIKVEEL